MHEWSKDQNPLVGEILPGQAHPKVQDVFDHLDPQNAYIRSLQKEKGTLGTKSDNFLQKVLRRLHLLKSNSSQINIPKDSSERQVQLSSITAEKFQQELQNGSYRMSIEQKKLAEQFISQHLSREHIVQPNTSVEDVNKTGKNEKTNRKFLYAFVFLILTGATGAIFVPSFLRGSAGLDQGLRDRIEGGETIRVSRDGDETEVGIVITAQSTEFAQALASATPIFPSPVATSTEIPPTRTSEPTKVEFSLTNEETFAAQENNVIVTELPVPNATQEHSTALIPTVAVYPTQEGSVIPTQDESSIQETVEAEATTLAVELDPTFSPTTTSTPTPTVSESSETESLEAVEPIPNVLEYIFNEEFMSSVRINRERMIGDVTWQELPVGYVWARLENGQYTIVDESRHLIEEDFAVPEGTDPNMLWIYDYRTIRGALGGVEEARRQVGSEWITFVFTGQDSRPGTGPGFGGHADTFMLVMFNVQDGRFVTVSLNRDMTIDEIYRTHGNVADPEISLATWYYNDADGVSRRPPPEYTGLLGMYASGQIVDGGMSINFDGIEQYIDALFPDDPNTAVEDGGLWINIPSEIDDETMPTENYGTTHFHLDAGPQYLTGEQVLMYARSRHSDLDGTISRENRQRQIIEAVFAQLAEEIQELRRQGDYGGALQRVQSFFSVTQTTFSSMEQNTRDLEAQSGQQLLEADTGYARFFGINPLWILDHIELVLSDPANVARLAASFGLGANTRLIENFRDGSAITSMQFTNADIVDGASTYVLEWAGVREAIAAARE